MGEFLDGEEEILTHGARLPHWQQGEVMQFVTFRLADSMPEGKITEWRENLARFKEVHPEPWDDSIKAVYHQRFTKRIEQWLDEGMGSCLFQSLENRETLRDVLMLGEGKAVTHQSWVIMPNHVHLLFTPLKPLPQIMKIWKGVSTRKIGKGSIWQPNYRDTLIRNSEHFVNAVRYIRRNPRGLREGTFTLWESERAKSVK